MVNLLASSYSYSYTTTNSDVHGGALVVVLLLALIVGVITIASMWKLFQKAGEAGWKSIIPIYNFWILAEIAGKPGWWALVVLLGFIPIIGPIASAVVYIIVYLEICKAFGKTPAFVLLLIFLPFIGWPILGFGDAKYTGKKYVTMPPTTPAS